MEPRFVSPIGVSPPIGVTIFAVAATLMLSAILHTADLAASPWVTGMKVATLAYFLWQTLEHALAAAAELPAGGQASVTARQAFVRSSRDTA